MNNLNYQPEQQPTSKGIGMTDLKKKIIFGVSGFFALVVLVTLVTFIGVEKIEGNERAVVQNWGGVEENVWGPGTQFYNGITTTPYVYNIGSEKFIMGKKEFYNGKGNDWVDYPAFEITTGGSGKEQPATFSVTLNYRLDPAKLIKLHNKAGKNYEDLVIKPALTRIISDLATSQTVLDFYSGDGRVKLQNDIQMAIENHSSLSHVGIIVDAFVIDDISLDINYVAEITGRQLATQRKLRAIEEAKAAMENAKKVEAEAEANKLKLIVEAEASKEQRIRAAQASAEEQTLAAEANKIAQKAFAEAERYTKEQNAKGLEAQGLAEARVAEAKRNSKYSGSSGARKAAVEIAQARVKMFSGMTLTGILDKDVAVTMINGTSPALTLPLAK